MAEVVAGLQQDTKDRKKEIIGLLIDRSFIITRLGENIGTLTKFALLLLAISMLNGFAIPIFIITSWWVVDHVVKKVLKPKIEVIKDEANTIIDI